MEGKANLLGHCPPLTLIVSLIEHKSPQQHLRVRPKWQEAKAGPVSPTGSPSSHASPFPLTPLQTCCSKQPHVPLCSHPAWSPSPGSEHQESLGERV